MGGNWGRFKMNVEPSSSLDHFDGAGGGRGDRGTTCEVKGGGGVVSSCGTNVNVEHRARARCQRRLDSSCTHEKYLLH